MSLLVTGGAGFIGSHLIERLLVSGEERLVCLDNFNDYYDPRRKRKNIAALAQSPRVRVVQGSFIQRQEMQRLFAEHDVRRVVHLGAFAGVRKSVEQTGLFEETNVAGTIALLEAARVAQVERFLLVSSSTVYGRGAAVPFQEDAPLGEPLSPYGKTKQAAERAGLEYFQSYGLPVVSLRPFSVWGPRIRPDLALWIFTAAILHDRPVPVLGDGSMARDFTHVSDVCTGLIAVLEAPAANVAGQAFNLGHGQPISMRDVIASLEAVLGKKAQIEYRGGNPADMPISWADLTKSSRILGFHPRVTLAQGLPEFVAWFRQEAMA